MRIAVVDDMPADARRLADYLDCYQKESGMNIQVSVFLSSVEFLERFDSSYDVLFLDIEMPGTNGIQLAHEVRSKDNSVGILFITNMAQYAIRGYEVNAIDFMVKPVSYYNFAEKLEKAMYFVRTRRKKEFLLSDENGMNRISGTDIYYVEKNRDYLVYHTAMGEFRERGTAKGLKEQLEGLPFAECTTGCLVNLEQVRRIGKDSVVLYGVELPLSRRMKKSFTQSYIDYIGGGF